MHPILTLKYKNRFPIPKVNRITTVSSAKDKWDLVGTTKDPTCGTPTSTSTTSPLYSVSLSNRKIAFQSFIVQVIYVACLLNY